LTASYSQRVQGNANFPAFATLGVPSLIAPVNTDGHVGNQLLGATFTYLPSDRWLHQVTVGFNSLRLNSDNYAPHNAYPGDTLRFADLETDDQLSARYVASTHRALSPTVTSSSTAGVEVSRRTFNYFQGSGLVDPQVAGSAQSDYIEAYKVTNNAGFFAQQVFGFGNRLFLTGGLRAEDNSNVGSSEGLIWAPRAGAAVTLALSDRIAFKPRGSFGKSIRPPQPGQAGAGQSSFSIQRPNPNLRAEVSTGVDAGFDLDYREGTVTFEATYFNQDAKDLIGLTDVGFDAGSSRSINQYQNVGTVNNKGVEFALGLRLGPVDARTSFSTVKSRIKSLAADYTGDQQVGDEMRNVARRAGGGTIGLNFRPLFGSGAGRDARLELGLTYVGGRRSIDLLGVYQCLYTGAGCRGPANPATGDPTFGTLRDYEQEIDPYTKIRIGFSHPLSRSLEGFLNIENLTNDQVGEWITIAPSRGRTVLVGVRFGL
jgi:outer membrane receptor protein involved in Fe transport